MKMHAMTKILPLICLISGGLLYSAAASAMGNDDTTTPTCPKGQVYDNKTQKCLPEKSSMIDDQDKTQYAYHLAKTGHYQDAINLLDTLQQPNTREAWNYRGYATRKLGKVRTSS